MGYLKLGNRVRLDWHRLYPSQPSRSKDILLQTRHRDLPNYNFYWQP